MKGRFSLFCTVPVRSVSKYNNRHKEKSQIIYNNRTFFTCSNATRHPGALLYLCYFHLPSLPLTSLCPWAYPPVYVGIYRRSPVVRFVGGSSDIIYIIYIYIYLHGKVRVMCNYTPSPNQLQFASTGTVEKQKDVESSFNANFDTNFLALCWLLVSPARLTIFSEVRTRRIIVGLIRLC